MIKSKSILIVIALLITINLYSENASIALQKPIIGLSIKKFQAWTKYRDGDYVDAIKRYKELSAIKSNDAFFHYMIGKSYLALKKYDDALAAFDKASKINPKIKRDLPLNAGIAFHKKGDLSNALRNYNLYISSLSPRQLDRDQLIQDYINSILMAYDLKANPVNVEIKKLGQNINSDYDDGAPSLSADGKMLFFTSRRVLDGFSRAKYADFANNDKMYVAKWDENISNWGKAELAENELTQFGHIGSLSVSYDGNTMFIYKNIPGVTKGGDIFYSILEKNGKWSRPIDMGKPINSSFFESSAFLAPDNNTLFFVSERRGGHGNADIYRSLRQSGNTWSKPENLGAVINSAYDELGVFVAPDGKTIYFASNGHRNMGGYDIFMSKFENGLWTQPMNLGYPINSEFDEKHFVLSPDGKKAYISSNREGFYNIYEVDMTNYGTQTKIEKVITYITEERPVTPLKEKEVKSKAVYFINIVNDKTNQSVASFTTEQRIEFALRLKSNETYSIEISSKEDMKNIAVIRTFDNGEFIMKTKDNDEFIVTVEKIGRQSAVSIKMLP